MGTGKGHYILFYDKIFTHEAFKREKFTEREMWLWMISKAAFSDHKITISAREVSLKRGQLFLSFREAMKQSGWSQERWKNYLSRLEEKNMVKVKTDTLSDTLSDTPKNEKTDTPKKIAITLITLVNFDKFQKKTEETDTPKNKETDTLSDTLSDTHNIIKNTTTPTHALRAYAREEEKKFPIFSGWSPCQETGKRLLSDYQKSGIDEKMARAQKAAFIAHYSAKGEINTQSGWEAKLSSWVMTDCLAPNRVRAKYQDSTPPKKKLDDDNFHNLCF